MKNKMNETEKKTFILWIMINWMKWDPFCFVLLEDECNVKKWGADLKRWNLLTEENKTDIYGSYKGRLILEFEFLIQNS